MRRTTEERFWAKVNKTEGCWLWTAATVRRGYGKFFLKGRYLSAPRFAWSIHNGPIPEGLCVLHRCDTPRCVRPDHLFLGTKKDNARDMAIKGRQHFQQVAQCAKGHPFDRRRGPYQRGCSICVKASKERYLQRMRADPKKREQARLRRQQHWQRFRRTHPGYVSPSKRH